MTRPARRKATNFMAVETYGDGCQKTTWKNFHENGHQHICVCGRLVDHNALATIPGYFSYTTLKTTTRSLPPKKPTRRRKK